MTLLREVTSEKGIPILATVNSNEVESIVCPSCGNIKPTCKKQCSCKCAMMDGKIPQDETKELLFG